MANCIEISEVLLHDPFLTSFPSEQSNIHLLSSINYDFLLLFSSFPSTTQQQKAEPKECSCSTQLASISNPVYEQQHFLIMTSKSTTSCITNNPNLPFQISTHSLISQALRNHLRSTGLLGECSDIRLKTFGRIYSLHRLLLIQSGFFNSMLLSGFKEGLDLDDAAAKRNKTKRKARTASQRRKSQGHLQSEDDMNLDQQEDDDDDDVIELHFDDPQVSLSQWDDERRLSQR